MSSEEFISIPIEPEEEIKTRSTFTLALDSCSGILTLISGLLFMFLCTILDQRAI